MDKSIKKPLLALTALIIVAIALVPIGNILEEYISPQKPSEIAAMPIGDTVLAGTKVVDDSKVRKTSTLYHLDYVVKLFQEGKYFKLFSAVITGTIETPFQQITGGSISNLGVADGFNGPGSIVVENNLLIVRPPDSFVWGFKTPYTWAVRNKEGIDIFEAGEKVKTVNAADINENNIPNNYINLTTFKKWYNKSQPGDNITLDYSISEFNDGRNSVPPSRLLPLFGQEVIDYMKKYPSGNPVMVFNGASGEEVVGTSVSVLESFPEYDDSTRALNAQQFVKGWDGTIVPPKTTAHGREGITFYGILDHNATGNGGAGWVTHGVCPPGRALRGAVMQAGFPLPLGMNGGYYSVAMDSNPTVGITVNNTSNYPVKIFMWTEGSGPSMRIFAKVVQYQS